MDFVKAVIYYSADLQDQENTATRGDAQVGIELVEMVDYIYLFSQ